MSKPNAVDDYLTRVIGGGDDISSQLEKLFAPTLKNRSDVEILSSGVSGIKVIRPANGMLAVVSSVGGDFKQTNPRDYVSSGFAKLIEVAEAMGAEPVAIANVIDAQTAEPSQVMSYAQAIAEEANRGRMAVMNGEFAVLGDRVTVPANVSLTMLSFVKSQPSTDASFMMGDIDCSWFDPECKPIYMNSDGVGTKTEFFERLKIRDPRISSPYRDSLAMKLDDLIKIGAKARVVSDVLEYNQRTWLGVQDIPLDAKDFVSDPDFEYIIHPEFVGDRIRSWKEGKLAVNLSGSAVSTIDEAFLANPPKPAPEEYLIAIRGSPNPRSNGITDKRKALVGMFGLDWHENPEGLRFLDFVAAPSTIFYPLFREALNSGNATSVYHMSGGAYNGKLARPLAKQGLFVELENIFAPDPRELDLAKAMNTPLEVAYAKWPMGNEGFVTSKNPRAMLEMIGRYELEGRIVGQLARAEGEKTGVLFRDIKGSDGKDIYFSGR